MTFEPEMLKSR